MNYFIKSLLALTLVGSFLASCENKAKPKDTEPAVEPTTNETDEPASTGST